jgi:hypothetical protein
VIFALWCGWGYVGCGLLPAWRQGWRGPTLLIAGVLASFALLFSSGLLLQFLGLPFTRGAWLGTITGLSVLTSLLPSRAAPERTPVPAAEPVRPWLTAVLLGAAGLAFVIITYRAVLQPLTGPDTIFRWNFLALQILHEGGLGFYPAITATDFTHYMWPEGIPPLVPFLYVWAYLGAGTAPAALTAPMVIWIAGLGFVLVGMLATRQAGRAAGLWAVALLAGSALHTWSVSMGQETGLTTLSVLALAWALGNGLASPDWRLAGLAAGVAALSREYGLTLVVIAGGWLLWRRRPWREWTGFAVISLVLVLPWYVRVWVRTGNPLYDLDVLGWFPVNALHVGLMQSFLVRYSFGGHLAERLGELGSLLWPFGAGVLLATVASCRWRLGWTTVMGLLAGLWLGLWLWSVGYTAGGLSYSLRVLSPLLALLAVAGGSALSRMPRAWHGVLAAVLGLLAAEASARALVMMRRPFRLPMRAWTAAGLANSAQNGDDSHDRAAALIGSHRVLVDDAYAHAYLVRRGVVAVPPWSPEVAYLWSADVDLAPAVHRLRASGVDFIWLTGSRDLRSYLDSFPFYRRVVPWLRPVAVGNHWVLFALEEKPGP